MCYVVLVIHCIEYPTHQLIVWIWQDNFQKLKKLPSFIFNVNLFGDLFFANMTPNSAINVLHHNLITLAIESRGHEENRKCDISNLNVLGLSFFSCILFVFHFLFIWYTAPLQTFQRPTPFVFFFFFYHSLGLLQS